MSEFSFFLFILNIWHRVMLMCVKILGS